MQPSLQAGPLAATLATTNSRLPHCSDPERMHPAGESKSEAPRRSSANCDTTAHQSLPTPDVSLHSATLLRAQNG